MKSTTAIFTRESCGTLLLSVTRAMAERTLVVLPLSFVTRLIPTNRSASRPVASQRGSSVPVCEVAIVVGAAVGTSLVAAWAAGSSSAREVGRPCEGVVGGRAGLGEKTEEERGAGIQ